LRRLCLCPIRATVGLMKIGLSLLRWRAAELVGGRTLAHEIGISYSTPSRIENGAGRRFSRIGWTQ
jgi:hypothetical protein